MEFLKKHVSQQWYPCQLYGSRLNITKLNYLQRNSPFLAVETYPDWNIYL